MFIRDYESPIVVSRLPNFGSKMGVDATTKWPSEGFTRPWPDEIKMDPEVKKKIDALWGSLGVCAGG
jgi:4-hydroxy-3-polyprenylbenzoate decarboxylase